MTTTLTNATTAAWIAELKNEAEKTNKLLSIVPIGEKPDWVPHIKSMKLGRLALHIAELPSWVTMTLTTAELDLGLKFTPTPTPSTSGELVNIHNAKVEEAISALENADETILNDSWTLRMGDHKIFTLPKKVVLREMCYNHFIHHRGQLSVYLRLLDIPIPGMYGPSADEA